ncbi:MAG: PaaI family thioesterase [Terricaulis sp.]
MSTFPIELMPFAKTLGIEIVEAAAERVVGKLLVRPELCTAGATLHGGAVMAFADSLGAIGAFLSLSEGAKPQRHLKAKPTS